MRLSHTFLVAIFALCTVTGAFAIVSLARAESVLWSGTHPTLYNGGAFYVPDHSAYMTYNDRFWQMDNTQTSVRYNVRVINTDTGEILGRTATVPQGTRLSFEFVPHVPEDISWSGTGSYNDTPYGDWASSLATSPSHQCRPADLTAEVRGDGTLEFYAQFLVQRPQKQIVGLNGFSCTPSALGQVCVASQVGTYTPVFEFDATQGHFYSSRIEYIPNEAAERLTGAPSESAIQRQCTGAMTRDAFGWCISGDGPAYIGCMGSDLPARSSSSAGSPGYIVRVPPQSIPHSITVTPAPENPEVHIPSTPALFSAAACTVGQAHSISFTSTDPDGDNLRYGIDWNADGTVNQWVPPSGYIPSGTKQTASRTYAISDDKTVKVLAQDEGGLSSDWATISFTCSESATAGFDESGAGGTTTGGGGSLGPPTADLDLRVIPSLVRHGNTTKVNWSSTGMQSCAVTGDNSDAWSALQSPIGGESSSPIAGETTYTLTCIAAGGTTHTKSATVHIIPTFQEL